MSDLAMPKRDPSDDPSHWYPSAQKPRTLPVQIVKLALEYSQPPFFGDTDTQRSYQQECAAAAERQTTEFALRPGCFLVSRTRGRLEAGAGVTVEDVGGDHYALVILTQRGVLHRLTPHELVARQCPDDARYVVGPSAITGTARGILSPGWPCSAADFAKPARPEVPAGEHRIARDGSVIPGRAGTPAEPADDGTAALARLIAKGLVIDRAATASNKGA